MPLIVNTNVAALNSQRNLGINNSKLSKSLERLSSGLRINRAADDAAGLAIATKFAAQVRGLNQAVRNSNNAIALLQTAEGGINTITNILQRMRELAVQSSSDDNTSADRANLAIEINEMITELTRVANTSEYNTMTLLDGQFSSKYFQIGANYSQKITFTISDTRGKAIGGRAQYSGDIADGVTTAVNENFGAGEIKVNGVDVAATNSTDDQYSVLNMGSTQLSDLASTAISNDVNLKFTINNTAVSIDLTASTAIGGSAIGASIVAAINAADITNVTARVVDGSGWVIEAKNGANVKTTYSMTTTATASGAFSIGGGAVGMNALSTMFGGATTVDNYNGESSAIAKAVAINAIKASSGVTATAQSQSVTGSSAVSAGTVNAGDIYINGVDIGAVEVTASDGTGALVTAINNQTSSTGVTASTDTDGQLILTAADGRNITVSVDDSTASGIMNLSGTATNNVYTYRSTVQLNDDESFTLTAAVSLEDLTGSSGTSISVASDVSTYNIALLSISTQANAEAAILTVDAALDDVNGIRAQLGAIQNRVEFTVANLEIASENMSASESRIRDADFALEVSIFTRNQILVQAGTAMLAQANTLPQIALQLLA